MSWNSFKILFNSVRTNLRVFRRPLPKSVKFQSVGLEHYDDVMAIRNNVYDGMDKLPALYHKMMKDHYAYTATLNGRHVAFMSIKFVDDGETVIAKCLRVSKDQKGRGLGHQLQRYVEQEHRGNKRRRQAAYTAYDKAMLRRVDAGTAELVTTRNITYFKGTQADIQKMALASPQVKVLKKEDVREIFRSREEKARLFPDERILVDSVPYRLRESNVDIFHDDHCHVLSSRILNKATGSGLLTVGYAYPTPGGNFCSIEIYGELTEDIFIKHIQQHAVELAGNGTDAVCIGCVCNGDTNGLKIICKIMQKFGFLKDERHTLYIAEEPIRF